MPKTKGLEQEGTVIEVLPNAQFKVELKNKHLVLAYMSGKMKKNYIRIYQGDRVLVELSLYEPSRGRVTYRLK